MTKIYQTVYGCSANVADYEAASGILKQAGFDFVDNEKQSDLNIIFTCTVKEPTVQKMIFRIKELTKSNKPLIVAGCMSKTNKKLIEKINPKASLLGPNSIERIVDAVKATLRKERFYYTEDSRNPKVCLPRIRRNPVINITPISVGCAANCSYCSVKFARGKLFSYPVEMIVEEVKRGFNEGCKEFYITSQDNSCYGIDIGTNLPKLLNEVCQVNGKFFVRVGMMNPLHMKSILNDLIHAYQNEKIFKFIHIPVQSGSDKILELMKRGYKVKDFLEIIKKFRKEFPQITLATDIIVGFPYEDDADFNKTIELVKEIKPDIVNISKFGSRTGTDAAKMEQIDRKTVNERSKKLHDLIKKISFEKKSWIGWRGEVLIDEKIEDGFVGRNFAYKPVVIKTEENLFGKFVNVEVVNAIQNSLIAKR